MIVGKSKYIKANRLLINVYKTCYIACALIMMHVSNVNIAYAQNTNPEDFLLPHEKEEHTAKPYNTDAFKPWMYFSIRFLAITVGAFPFGMLVGGIGFDTHKTITESQNSGSFQSKYLPLFFGGAEKPPYNSDDVGVLLINAAALSVAVSFTDLIIGIIKHNRKKSINELFISSLPP